MLEVHSQLWHPKKSLMKFFFYDDFSSFTIGRMINDHRSSINTDLECLKKNKISITPLSLNLSNNEFFNKMNHDI